MRPIRSVTLSALALAVFATALTGCDLGSGEQQDTSDIVIAADLELSGATANIGEAYQRALQLKIDQVNQSGALGARKLTLKPKDNRSDESLSLRNVDEFVNDPSVAAIIMGTCGTCAANAAKTINEKKMPTISLSPSSETVNPVADRRYIFKLAPNAPDNAAALATELKTARKKKVGLLYTDDRYGQEGLSSLSDELNKADITLTGSEQVKGTDTDVSQAIGKLLEDEPDAIVLWTFAEQAALAAQVAKQEKFSGDLFLDAGAAGGLFLTGPAAAMNGATMVFPQTMVIDDVIATTPAKAARKRWFQAYTARYGSYYGFASFAADAVQMIVDAIQDTGGVDREKIRNFLETSQLDGLSGQIRMRPSNHSGLMPQALTTLVARSGRWRLAG